MGGASDENRQPLAKPVLEATKTTAEFRPAARAESHMWRAPHGTALRRFPCTRAEQA